MVLMRHAAAPPGPPTELPSGFTLRPLRGQSEVGAYVDLHRSVFNSDSMTEAWRAAVLRQPAYDADLDLVIADPDDELAAFCIGWLGPTVGTTSPAGRSSLWVSPIATADRALAEPSRRSACAVCMPRVHTTSTSTDLDRNAALALYEAVGFRVERSILVFRKTVWIVRQ